MTEKEVKELEKQIYADGKVDENEINQLWDLKAANVDNAAFKNLFVHANMDHIFADGKMDEDEANELIDRIGEDGMIDNCEQALIEAIVAKGKDVLPKVWIDYAEAFFD